MAKKGKHTKFWATLDPETKKGANELIEKIKRGKIMDQHRRIFKSAECGD